MMKKNKPATHCRSTGHRRAGLLCLGYLREILGGACLLGGIIAGLQKMEPASAPEAAANLSGPIYNVGFVGVTDQFWIQGLHRGLIHTDLGSSEDTHELIYPINGPGTVARGGREIVTTAIADCLGQLIIVRGDDLLVQFDASKEGRSFPTVDVSADGSVVVGMLNEGGFIRWTWNGSTFEMQRWTLPGPHETLVLSADGGMLAISQNNSQVQIWNLPENRITRTTNVGSQRVSQLQWSHQGDRLATASDDGFLRLWDVSTGALCWETQADTLSCLTLSFSSDDARIVTGGFDKVAREWDVATGRKVSEFHGHTGPVRSVAYHPELPLLVTAGLDGQLRRWKLKR